MDLHDRGKKNQSLASIFFCLLATFIMFFAIIWRGQVHHRNERNAARGARACNLQIRGPTLCPSGRAKLHAIGLHIRSLELCPQCVTRCLFER